MIALKIIGAVLILTSGYLFGKHIKDDMRNRSDFIFYINKALAYIENKIVIENAYLEDILAQCQSEIYKGKDMPQPFGLTHKKITEKNENIVDAWQQSMAIISEENDYIKDEEKEYMYQVGACLYIPDKTRQSQGLKTIIENLDIVAKKVDEKAKKDGKMALQISMICAILLIILII